MSAAAQASAHSASSIWTISAPESGSLALLRLGEQPISGVVMLVTRLPEDVGPVEQADRLLAKLFVGLEDCEEGPSVWRMMLVGRVIDGRRKVFVRPPATPMLITWEGERSIVSSAASRAR